MGTIDIFNSDGSVLANVIIEESSYRRYQIMGEHAVTLNFKYEGFLVVPVGAYINFKGLRYTLLNPAGFTKAASRNYDYSLKLEAYQGSMTDAIFINIPDGRTSFSRTARPAEFLQSLVDNLNREDTGWSIGACIDAVQKEIQFNETTCAEALKLLAEAFKTEWEVVGKEISLRKVEYFKDAPLALSYGMGNGFLPGLGRGNFDDNRPINRLFVRGGERNIDYSNYGSQNLVMPADQTIRYDGSHFEGEDGFTEASARTYAVSDDGRSLVRTDGDTISKREGSVELTEIYPMREGTVTGIVWLYKGTEYTDYAAAVAAAVADGSTAGSVFCNIFDTTIPDSLDYSQWRIDGEQMIVTFQSGRLSGRDIGIQQDDHSLTGYDHATRRFQLITTEEYGAFIPDSRLAVGDKYACFGMTMPAAYIRDDATKSGASWDLFREAVRYKYENEEYRFTFKGTLDGIWARARWDTIEDKIIPGGYISFSDPQFQPEGVLIRISAIKDYLVEPFKPELELTNVVIGGGLRSEVRKIDQQEVVIDDRIRDIANLTVRQWRDKEELRRGLARLHLEFSEGISPITVNTMQLLVGSSQCQFRFVSSSTAPAPVNPVIAYDPTTNTLSVQAGIIQHMTLGIDAISGTHAVSEYKFWGMDAFTSSSAEPLENDKPYWLYAHVPKTGTDNGTFAVSLDEMPFDDGDYYNLLVGFLNSEYNGTRAWTPLFGSTEILPGQVVTDMIRSNDGGTYFDLLNSEIGGRIAFKDGIISGNIAVSNDDQEITAMISGNNSDTSNIAYSAGGGDKNAQFYIQHDGRVVANNASIRGRIEAQSGIIGKFNIGADGGLTNNFNEDAGRIVFRYDPNGVYAGMGTNVLPPSSGLVCAARFENTGDNPNGTNLAAYFLSNNSEENSAIYIGGGFITGFAVNTKIIDDTATSYTVGKDDCYLSCYNTSSLSVTLPAPSSMEVGKVIYVRRVNSAITLIGKIHANGVVSSIGVGAGIGDTAVLVNDGQYWCYNYMVRG